MGTFFTLAIIQLLGSVSPGPDSMLVINNSLTGSKKNGIFTALGIVFALLVHVVYINLGIAVLISKSDKILFYIKIAGAIYLSYLGIKMILSKKITQDIQDKFVVKSSYQAFQEGFLCNLLNPKAILFLLGVFTLVINDSNTFFSNAMYAIEILLIPLLWFFLLSYLINIKAVKEKLLKIQNIIVIFMGMILIAFAVKLMLV